MSTFLVLFLILVSTIIWYLINSVRRPNNYPPGPKWLPLVGNTAQLRKLAHKLGGQHLAFEYLAEKYKSPLIGLRLGNENVVVALTYPMVREIHTREEFEGRPNNFFLRLRTMGSRLGITCTDGSLWSEHRNFTTRHLRQAGYGRLPMEMQIQNELNELLSVIHDLNGEPAWPGIFLPPSVLNVLWTFVAGTRIPRNDKRLNRLLELLQKRSKAFDMSGGVLGSMPWLRFIAPEKTGYNLIQRFNFELHKMFMETINEHKLSYTEDKANDDLVYAYIKEMNAHADAEDNTYTDVQLTMTILDIFIAGSQTTSTTLDLALMMMLLCPDVQQKVKTEIDVNLPNSTLPTALDKSKLPYTEAVLMEIQRLFHIVPITGPRRALRSTTLGGYTIPKNTTILIGLHSVHMDKEHWKDPDIFRPERYLKEGKIFNDEYHMPFGQGKRKCLGDALARACLFTFFVGILQKFTLKVPKGESLPSVKLMPGITLSPIPYKIEFIPR